jgi:ferredoxin-like protein FixX
MVKSVKKKICLECNIQANFNVKGETKPLFCSKHKKDGMIDIRSKRCLECDVIATFNIMGEKNGLYCAEHKIDGMIDVKNKTCIYVGCSTRPSYNFSGKKVGIYCVKHKLSGMIDVQHRKCIECGILPSFNLKGNKIPLYCLTHKHEGMVNVVNKTCLECDKQAMFNVKGKKRGLYCVEHKKNGMIDVKNKKCLECEVRPTFNNVGQKKGLYCLTHKKEGMVDVKHKKCLECEVRPTFNKEGQKKGLYCLTHKKEGMVDVLSKTCKSDWCSTIPRDKKYDGYCLRCFIYLFPDKPITRNYKTKEYAVVDFIKTKFPHFDFIADKIISGGCSRRRPDLLLDILYQIIIIEVDENQHTDYDCSCQNKRLMELSQDLGHRPIVFIRFNPDDYKKDGKNITSCWGQNKNGICVVKKSKQKEWLERLNTLEDQIKYWTSPENMTDKTIEIIHLYYDM